MKLPLPGNAENHPVIWDTTKKLWEQSENVQLYVAYLQSKTPTIINHTYTVDGQEIERPKTIRYHDDKDDITMVLNRSYTGHKLTGFTIHFEL